MHHHFQTAAKFFGQLCFQNIDEDAEIEAKHIAKSDIDPEILESLLACLMMLRGFGCANPHIKAEVLEGMEIVYADLRER